MLARLRSLLLKTPIKIALGLVAAYFLFAWFGFEPLLKWAAPKYLADKSRHTLTLETAKFDPLSLSVELKGLSLAEPDAKPLLSFARLFVDFDAASLFNRAWTFEEIRLTAPDARVELRADGSLNWSALIEALKSEDEEEDTPLPRLLIRHIALEKGRVGFVDRMVAGGFETVFNPLDLTLHDLSTLPNDRDRYTLAATTQAGARIRVKGELMLNPFAASGDLGIDQVTLARYWPYIGAKLNMSPPAGTLAASLRYRVAYADKRLSLLLEQLGVEVAGLGLRGKDAKQDAIALERLALSGGRFDLEKRRLELGEIALSGGHIALRRDQAGRLDLMDWLPPATAEAAPVVAKPTPDAATGWRIDLTQFSLNGLGIQFNDAGFATPLDAEVGNLQLGFKASAEVGGAASSARLEDLGVSLSGIRLTSGNKPLFVLGGIHLEDGLIDLDKREARIGKLSLANGKLDALRDARGRIALLEAFEPAQGKSTAAKPARSTRQSTKQTEAPGWRYALDRLDLSGFQVALRDETMRPAGGLTLQGIEATASGLSDNLKAAVPVSLGFKVKEGGRFQAAGKVIPERLRADLKLQLDGLALAPAQPWLSQAANLTLASGRATTQGRARFDGKASGSKRFDFKGGFAVDDLLLKESETGERFLAWKRLGSDTVGVTPAGLDIDELKLDSLGAKLVIYPDKTVNLKKILRASESDQAVPATAAPPVATRPEPAFRLNIDRVRVEHGEVDFADLSLALPFGTRIHDFKGAVNGISSQPGAAAELELDGRVDEYGLARVVGQIDLFDPTGFMDIKTVFRNVEMTNLTPYTATFVGRKIESGKLSLDLEYKIKKRQLLGENQIVMDKLTLGERIQSSTAKDLPLDLAIAILQDSDGRIDLGLPVSGSLDDPQFSYGRIIWKAIGNILTKIVTAPFRALAGLFGGNGEKLERIVFEPGEAGLTPPEKEKLKQITGILNKRPGLALSVHGAWSEEIDRPVLRERQLRRAVVEKMGVKLAPDEDAGPISTAHPKARIALEALYAARFGEDDWRALQAKWFQSNPEQRKEGGTGKMLSRLKSLIKPEAPLSEADLDALKGADLHALLHARLLERESVDAAALMALAERRAQAIVAGLAQTGAPVARIQAVAAETFTGAGGDVPVRLELGVASRR